MLNRLLLPLNFDYIEVGNHVVLKSKANFSADSEVDHAGDLSSSVQSMAEIPVKGKVSAFENKGPLPGVSVFLKGSNRGTSTNANGEFTISVPSNKSILIFSFIGYQSQEVLADDVINVTLKEDIKALDEVVVVGYGVQKKKDLTGAISTIGADMFKERKETQVSQALQGAMSGVMVTRSGGNGSMSGANIRIRGITTIGNSNPLVMVDGVPVADVNQVNPNDIESLTVLKDAASASIYGSRAA